MMKIASHDLRKTQFDYFLGKPVTIVTNDSNVKFDVMNEKGAFLHFKTYGGVCEGFDEYGVWLLEPVDNVKSFYFYSAIQGIVENPQKDRDDPAVKEMFETAKVKPEPRKKDSDVLILQDGDGITEPAGELTMEMLQRMVKENQVQ